MKFAKELDETLVPEWRASYFDYKTGKKRLKALAKALRGVPRRVTHHPELPLVRDSNNVAQNTPAISIAPASNVVNERSPLQPKPKQRLEIHGERPSERKRMASYGSIIGSPPNSPAAELKSHITPVPSLELPGPATRRSEDIDRSSSISFPTHPTPSAHPFGLSANTQLAHTGNAYEIRPPTDLPVERDAAPRHGSSRFRSLFPKRTNSMPNSRPLVSRGFSARDNSSPKKHRDDHDVALETYKEADFREAEFFLFLDKELLKIEKFYKTKEDEAKVRLAAIREQLHIMREFRLEEIMAHDQRHRAEDAEFQALDRGHADRRSKDGQSVLGNTRQLVARPFVKSIDLATEAFDRIRPGHIGKTSQAMRSLATPDDNTWTPQPNQRDYHRRSHQDVPYRDAKRKMKLALSEHYRGLELLKSYAEANRKAFRKINKKYDKTVNANPPQRYMNEQVSKSYFNTSDEVDSIMSIVEDLYARYFEKGNRKVAISKLRAKKAKEDAHSGAIIRTGALLAAGSVLSIQGVVEGTQLLYPQGTTKASQTSFLLQLYGGYFLMFLLAMFFALCTRVFTNNKVNYQFIFELNRRHALSWRQIWEIPSWFLFLFGLTMYLNFNVQAGGDSMYRWWPVVLIGLAVVLLFLPAPIFYHRARKWFLYSMWRLVLAGFYDVEYRDFFLGDMFCSLTYAIGGIEIFFCLYANDWNEPARCTSSHSIVLGFLSTLPGIWRANQCLRRYYSTHELFPHIANFGKYICTILMYMTLSLYRRHLTTEMKGLFIAFAIVNSIYTSIWDIAMDWSLGDPEAKHRWLRKTLAYRDHIWWYYGAMVIDPILRFNWIFYIIIPLGSQHSTIVSFLIALSEVFRRGVWTLLRVENEHCSNIRNEKASKDLPLPYKLRHEYDEEEDVETSHSDSSGENATDDPAGTVDLEDKRKPIRAGLVHSSDISSLDLDKKQNRDSVPSKPKHLLHPDRSSTTEDLHPARSSKNTQSLGNNTSNASHRENSNNAQTSPELGRNAGLERQSTGSNNSVRRRPRRHQSSSSNNNNMAGSPIASALHRVGTTMRAAHERDFARKKPATDGAADSSDEDDEDDSDDE